MILEDYRSNVMKCETVIDEQKLYINYLEEKRASLEEDNQELWEKNSELIKQRDDFKQALGKSNVQLNKTQKDLQSATR